jgi:hypothetical protein
VPRFSLLVDDLMQPSNADLAARLLAAFRIEHQPWSGSDPT